MSTEDDGYTPVLVSEKHGHVSVLMLLGTGKKHALYEGDRWKEIGQVVEVVSTYTNRQGFTAKKSVWRWHFDELEYDKDSGEEPTKAKAIAELLERGQYEVAEPNSTIPDLF